MRAPLHPLRAVLVLLVLGVGPLWSDDTAPQTVTEQAESLVGWFEGQDDLVVHIGSPATLFVRHAFTDSSVEITLKVQGPDGKQAPWPWKAGRQTKLGVGGLWVWTLSPSDTAVLQPGTYTLRLQGSGSAGTVACVLDVAVEAGPAADKDAVDLAYQRAIGDHASALAAAERRHQAGPKSIEATVAYGRCLLAAGRAQGAYQLAFDTLDQLPPAQNEPPVALLRLQDDAIRALRKNDKP